MKYLVVLFILALIFAGPARAMEDPRDSSNNIVGIGILSPEADLEEAASLVNSGGEWGWVLIIIKSSERNVDRWQSLFHQLAKYKVIPIVRIATDFDGRGFWQRPQEDDADAWAEFLSKLHWPTKNRYVQVYNEVNRAGEWGGSVDPEGYARELEKTISALKQKSGDFFVLNAPLDQELGNSPTSLSEDAFLDSMDKGVQGIFKKIDGLASHSYPNPSFAASPAKSGRGSIDGYNWELSYLSRFLGEKDLPVFITETGWNRSYLSEQTIAHYFEIAFSRVWNNGKVVAVTPFILDYPESLYESFSFKTNGHAGQALGKKYWAQYEKIQKLPKVNGEPAREDLASDLVFGTPSFILKDATRQVSLSLKNVGNYIWNRGNLTVKTPNDEVEIFDVTLNKDAVYPGQEANVTLKIKAKSSKNLTLKISVSDENRLLARIDKDITVETYPMRLVRILKSLVNA